MTSSPLRSTAAAGHSEAEPSVSPESTLTVAPDSAQPAPEDLPVWLRITLIILGIVLLAVGIAGLVLPGLQGILTILLALALLSLVSHHAHRFLAWCLKPWPKMHHRVEGYREKMFAWINRKLGGVQASAVGAEEAAAEEREPRHPTEPHISLECHRIGQPTAGGAESEAGPQLADETLSLERQGFAHSMAG